MPALRDCAHLTPGKRLGIKSGRDLYIGGRLGFRATPRTLVYGKAGYTNARLDLTASDGTTETGNHYNLDGYRVGAGVEEAIGRNTYAKVEYRYSNYGTARLEYPSGANTGNFSVDTDRHQVVVGVGVRFGSSCPKQAQKEGRGACSGPFYR